MKLKKIYLEEIAHLPGFIQESIIREAPHTLVGPDIPPELSFLGGTFVDLGFENLGLDEREFRAVGLAFVSNGVGIPGTPWKLRYLKTGDTQVEPIEGADQMLPENWKQAVLVLGSDRKWSWIGRRVRPDQIGVVDFSLYSEEPDGFSLNI